MQMLAGSSAAAGSYVCGARPQVETFIDRCDRRACDINPLALVGRGLALIRTR
jgi:hypothetical protein